MALFENSAKRAPLGIELVRRGIITEKDIDTACAYKREHPKMKLGEIFHVLKLASDEDLLNVIGEQLGVKPIMIDPASIDIKFTDYVSMDIVRQHKVLPFAAEGNKVKVAFADPTNASVKKMVQMIIMNKNNMNIEVYVTFESMIDDVIKSIDSKAENTTVYDSYDQDITQLIDNIIRSAMVKRASDIHFEPMEDKIRIRYRIDGELIEITTIDKDKQTQIIGRL